MAWAYDVAGNTASQIVLIDIGNGPPQGSGSGKAIWEMLPNGIVSKPATVKLSASDPEGDAITATLADMVNGYVESFDPNNLIFLFQPYLGNELACEAVRNRDIVKGGFSVILQDSCGAGSVVWVPVEIEVRDKVPPVITMSPNVDLGCHCSRPDTTPAATGWPQVTDNCDSRPTIAYSEVEEVQGEFHTITRDWVATDSCGNPSQGTQIIRFRIDQTPPVLSVPPNADLGCHCTPPAGLRPRPTVTPSPRSPIAIWKMSKGRSTRSPAPG